MNISRTKLILALIVVGVAAFFARPVAEFAWITAGRAMDIAHNRYGLPTLRPLRAAVLKRNFDQGDQIDGYLRWQRLTSTERPSLRVSLGYPPPGFEKPLVEPVAESVLGEDAFATYRVLSIPALPGVYATGLYLRPKGAKPTDRLPLVIAAAGRGGMPEETADGTLPGLSKSTRDLSWEALKHGYAVWVPTYVHYGRGEALRERLTVRAMEAGTTLPAIEIAQTVKALDALLRRDDIDPNRVAMMGHSYGGFYTLYTTALDKRNKVAVVAAYFNDRAAVLDASEPYGFLDWRFMGSLSSWTDPAVAALVAPRPLLIVAGTHDQLFPIEGARKAGEHARHRYQRAGSADHFEFQESTTRHDFDGVAAMAFIDKHLGQP